ncbi:hypothetical protein PHMEG_00021534 [Phytophthora megakarya]|uniref:Uncharacterized protein n=1 Tax=Phytophthora megakarya TaxID=4795 RepID=A0A225VNX5_9STRA|nr:hypothetical protein PHMEG_00021534 [Phytophthora megakarya]
MATVDWEDLARQVTEIQRNSYGHFIAWIVLNKPSLVSPAFAGRLAWLLTLEKSDGSALSYSTLNTH